MTVFLACLSDRGCVNEGHDLFEVIEHCSIKQRLVSIEQGDQKDVAFEGGRFATQIREYPLDLLLLRLNMGRQQSVKSKRISLRLRESSPFIGCRVVQNFNATARRALRGRG